MRSREKILKKKNIKIVIILSFAKDVIHVNLNRRVKGRTICRSFVGNTLNLGYKWGMLNGFNVEHNWQYIIYDWLFIYGNFSSNIFSSFASKIRIRCLWKFSIFINFIRFHKFLLINKIWGFFDLLKEALRLIFHRKMNCFLKMCQ